MNANQDSRLSRRQWVGLVAAPAIAATLRAELVHAQPSTQPASDDRLIGARVFNVRDYGAKGDGATLDTAAVQAAIDACHRERGGTVLVPAGEFLVGTLQLKSNVTLHVAVQGKLLGSPRRQDYAAGEGVPPGNGNIVLLYAVNAENICIEGRGAIDGQGAAFYTGEGDNTGPNSQSGGNRDRPHLAIFYRCNNLLLRDALFTRSAYHCFRILQCRHVRIDGVRIYNRVNKNNDGFHFNSCQHVHISNCDVVCQDDACALFGSNKFVTVTNCSFSTRWSIFRFGGGEAENITVSNCIIHETYGCPIKLSCSGRARFENMLFTNLVMKNVTGPISIGLDSRARRGAPGTQALAKGVVRNIVFSHIRATVVPEPRNHEDIPFDVKIYPGEQRTCIVVNGVGEDVIENISFSDVHVVYPGGGTAEEAATRDVPQIAGEYFQIGVRPAYGLYARNVRGLVLENVRFEVVAPDLRPAVVLEGVQDAAITALSAQGNEQAESLLRCVNSQDVLLSGLRVLSKVPALLQVEGQASRNITVDGGQLAKADKPLILSRGASETAVNLRA